MPEYVAKWELCAGQFASMDAPTDEGLLVTMFIESFGDRLKSPYGMNLPEMLTREELTWQAIKLRLLQE